MAAKQNPSNNMKIGFDDSSSEDNSFSTQPMNTQPMSIQPRKSYKKYFITLLVLLVLGIGGFSFYKYYYTQTDSYKEAKVKKDTENLIQQVSKHMLLPTDEEPVIFDVTDPQALVSQQAFFNGAEKGDRLLVYSKVAKAIIYSPSRDMIINVGPITFDQEQVDVEQAKKATTPSSSESDSEASATPKKATTTTSTDEDSE